MAFTKRTWIARDVQYPGRRILTPTGNTNEYDITRSEGTINAEGDIVSKENLDDLENRIFTGLASGTNGDADNALKLGGVLAGSYATITNATLTLLNGWTVSQTYTPKAYKCGNLVVVTGNITGGTVGNGTSLATLPVGYRPSLNQWVQIFTFSGAQYSALINTDGVIGQIGTWVNSEIVRFNFVIGL